MNKRRSRLLLEVTLGVLLFVTVYAAASFFDAWIERRQRSTRMEQRVVEILRSEQAEQTRITIIGDSIVEIAQVTHLCGRATLNAGVAGATVSELEPLSRNILGKQRPELIVVAVGVNDAAFDRPTKLGDFDAAYKKLLSGARRTGAEVVAMNIGPVARENKIFDPARIQALNRRIGSYGIPVIDLWNAMRAEGRQSLPPSFTDDGTHPSPTGYIRWKNVLARSCDYLARSDGVEASSDRVAQAAGATRSSRTRLDPD